MKLTLKPFKRLKSVEIVTAPLTLLTGTNCGGKTSVLQSLVIARLNTALKDGEEFLKVFRDVSRTGLPLGEPRDYCPYGSEGAFVSIEAQGSSFGYALHLDNTFKLTTFDSLDAICAGAWRISPVVPIPLDAEQFVGNRSGNDAIFDGKHALMELADREHAPCINPLSGEQSTLRAAVELTLEALTVPTSVDVRRIPELADRLSLRFRSRSLESEWVSPVHHGAGLTSILPLAIHLCAAKVGDTVIVQDPEANLHPSGQSRLGRLLARAARRGVQLFIESHSEHILNGIRLDILESNSDFDQLLSCYYLTQRTATSESVAMRVAIDKRGRVVDWPKGFFDQSEIDLGRILQVKKK